MVATNSARPRHIASEARNYANTCNHIEKATRDYIETFKENKVDEEVIAQAILAIRHLEDANMRFSKVVEYLGDSVYTQPPEVKWPIS